MYRITIPNREEVFHNILFEANAIELVPHPFNYNFYTDFVYYAIIRYASYRDAIENSEERISVCRPDNIGNDFGFLWYDGTGFYMDKGVKRDRLHYATVYANDRIVIDIPAWLMIFGIKRQLKYRRATSLTGCPTTDTITSVWNNYEPYYNSSILPLRKRMIIGGLIRTNLNNYFTSIYPDAQHRKFFLYGNALDRIRNTINYTIHNGVRVLSIRTPIDFSVFRVKQSESEMSSFSVRKYGEFEFKAPFKINRLFIPYTNHVTYVDIPYGVRVRYRVAGIEILKKDKTIPITIHRGDYGAGFSIHGEETLNRKLPMFNYIDVDIDVIYGDKMRVYYVFDVEIVNIEELSRVGSAWDNTHPIFKLLGEDIAISFRGMNEVEVSGVIAELEEKYAER